MDSSPVSLSSLTLLLYLLERKRPLVLFYNGALPALFRGTELAQHFGLRDEWLQDVFWQKHASAELTRQRNAIAIFDCRLEHLPTDAFSVLAKRGFTQAIFQEQSGEWFAFSLLPYRTDLPLLVLQKLQKAFSGALRAFELNLRRMVLKRWGVDLHDAGVKSFLPSGGYCFTAYLPQLQPFSDDERRDQDKVYFFEEKTRLVPHVPHTDVRDKGMGRCSHWCDTLFFSSTDGTDPNGNRRRYRYLVVAGKKSILRPLFRLSSPFTAPAPLKTGETYEKFEVERSLTGTTQSLKRVNYETVVNFEERARELIPRDLARGFLGVHQPLEDVHLLISSLGPGGAERQMCYLARELHARGVAVRVLTWEQDQEEGLHYFALLRDAQIPVSFVSRPNPDFTFSTLGNANRKTELELLAALPEEFGSSVWNLYTHLMVHRPRILHCSLDISNVIGGIAGWLAGVHRIVLSTRNLNPSYFPYIFQPWYQRWYSLLETSPRVRLIGNSRVGAESYAKWLDIPNDCVGVVHNGLDLDIIRTPTDAQVTQFRLSLGIPAQAPLIAGVFRLNYEKRPFLFLKVVAALKRKFPELRAVIAGVGPLAEQVREEIESRGLATTVFMLGRRSDIPVVLRAADICLLTSAEEGLPNVLMESQWLERPVVCPRAGGAPEVVLDRRSGFVCEQGDYPELVEKCSLLLADPALRSAFGKVGREFIRREFSLEKMVCDTARAYGSEFELPPRREQLSAVG